jgi:hypothetical protein
MKLTRSELAAENNAVWCDTVCRAHGVPGEFQPGLWLNRQPTPRYYPNAVTLAGAETLEKQFEFICQLLGAGLPAGWAVKDSFCALDLSGLGFDVLFEASWIWLDPFMRLPDPPLDGLAWRRVTSASALAEWEAAWAGHPEAEPPEPPIFLPALLVDPEVAVLAAYQDRQIIAGAVASHSGQVVGLSNLFAPAGQAAAVWTRCINFMQILFTGLPVVGYERGAELEIARSLGFDVAGPLRVWVQQPHS